MKVVHLINQFALNISVKEAKPFGSGHINETFRLINADPEGEDFLLQKINHHVFKDVEGMMNNIHLVTEYLRSQNGAANEQETLRLIQTNQGKSFFKDSSGEFWRIFDFKKKLVSYDVAETADQIYEGARSFGIFLNRLSDFPVHKLVDTIPDFHNVVFRINNLNAAVEQDSAGRLLEVKDLVSYALSITDEMTRIQRAGEAGLIPSRVTHNDTKFNNVMLSKEGKGLCVIDLDTIMPGYVHYDFGDGIRTTICTAVEDEVNLDNIQIDLDRFHAFTSGYLAGTRDILSKSEMELLGISGALFAYLMGIRFLTDYLMGDVYYKTHFEGHNLQRAKAQLDLCRKILERLKDLENIIRQKH